VVGATNQPMEVAESMMSYAELQAQLAALCGTEKKGFLVSGV